VSEPLWLERGWVDALHFQQLSRFGGLHGVRDEGALESALGRPRNQWEYGEERDLVRLGAAYAFGLARNHGYSDGNKRIAFVAMAVFLDLNGLDLVADEDEVVRVMLALAAGELEEVDLAEWVRGRVIELPHSHEE
jgi:death on curing protein